MNLSSEILTAVSADDDMRYSKKIEAALKELNSGNRVHIATGARNLLEFSLTGFDGNQADIVYLDDNYGDLPEWKVDRKWFLEFGNARNRPFYGESLIYEPSSVTFAIMLRHLGYEGKIAIVSSAPPRLSVIESYVEAIGVVMDLPIDGTVTKRSLADIIFVGQRSKEIDGKSKWKTSMIEDGTMEDGIKDLSPLGFLVDRNI